MSAPDRRSLDYLLQVHIEGLGTKGFSPLTLKTRRDQLKAFARWCEERGTLSAAEVTPAVLLRYQRWLFHYRKEKDGRPLSWASQANRLGTIRRFFAWLVKTGRLASDPAAELELPKIPKRLPPVILSAPEAEAVLRQPDLSTREGLRDRAILELLYSTGMRRAEAAALLLVDFDPARGLVRVRQGKGGKDRYVPIGERAIRWVEKYLGEARPRFVQEHDGGALFLNRWGDAFHPNGLTQRASAYLDRATGKPGACHVWRHTAATLMHEAGADIRHLQELLGHEDLSTTQIYTRVAIKKLQEVHARTHPARMGRGPEQEPPPSSF